MNWSLRTRRSVVVACLATMVLSGSISEATSGFSLVAATRLGGASGSEMFAVSSSSISGAWAVGRTDNGIGGGAIWRIRPTSAAWVSVALPSPHLPAINDVSTFGTSAWIIGSGYQTSRFVYEWNGTSWLNHTVATWPASFHAGAILINGTKSVWVAGIEGKQPACAHWNGSSWSFCALKHIFGVGESGFSSLTAIPGTMNVIVAGYRNSQGRSSGVPFAEMWNGSKWNEMPSAAVSGGLDASVAVSASSSTNAWMVSPMFTGTKVEPVIMHWNGVRWKQSPAASAIFTSSGLIAVDTRSASDAWAVGDISTGLGENAPLIEHWDGTSWQIVPSQPKSAQSLLTGVSLVPGSTCRVLAVGVATFSLDPNVPFGERNC